MSLKIWGTSSRSRLRSSFRSFWRGVPVSMMRRLLRSDSLHGKSHSLSLFLDRFHVQSPSGSVWKSPACQVPFPFQSYGQIACSAIWVCVDIAYFLPWCSICCCCQSHARHERPRPYYPEQLEAASNAQGLMQTNNIHKWISARASADDHS